LDTCVARVNLSLLSNPTAGSAWVISESRWLVTETWSRNRARFWPSHDGDLLDEKISGYDRDVVKKPTLDASRPAPAVTAGSQAVQSSPNLGRAH
jgi:hypothetical protein